MDDVCKDWLDKVGFIVQAIKVDEMTFKFYNKSEGEVKINAEILNNF